MPVQPLGAGAPKRCARAFTRLELLAILVAISLLAAVAWPTFGNDQLRTGRAICANNLHRIGEAFASWATDHDERYPWFVYYRSGGTSGGPLDGYAYYQFATLSNEVGTPSVFACPSDGSKSSTRNFNVFSDSYVSYLVSHPLISDGRAILSGDRNLASSQSESCFEFGSAKWLGRPSTNAAWNGLIHAYRGHLLFNDGAVESTDNGRLRSVLSAPGLTNNFHYIAPQ